MFLKIHNAKVQFLDWDNDHVGIGEQTNIKDLVVNTEMIKFAYRYDGRFYLFFSETNLIYLNENAKNKEQIDYLEQILGFGKINYSGQIKYNNNRANQKNPNCW